MTDKFPSLKSSEAKEWGPNVFGGYLSLNALELDSGASFCLFTNSDFLKQLQDAKRPISIHWGGTFFHATKTGSLYDALEHLPLPQDGYYYHEKGVANLLSLARVAAENRVVLDTAIDNAFYVLNENGFYIQFACQPNDLYCLHVSDDNDPKMDLDCTRAKRVRY